MTEAAHLFTPTSPSTTPRRPAPSPRPAFAAQYARFDRMMAGYERALLDAAALHPGGRVLDVGCGAGSTSLHAAAMVGPGGRVVGIDRSEATLEVARRRALASGLAVRFTAADAAHWCPPGPGAERFDALVSRFGNLHFEDPVAAHGHLHSLLRPGGRLCFVCGRDPKRNAWATLPLSVLTALADRAEGAEGAEGTEGADRAGPGASAVRPVRHAGALASGPFAFADPVHVRRVLSQAGFGDVSLTSLDWDVYVGADVDDALEFFYEADGARLAGLLERVGYGRATEALRVALSAFAGPEGVRMPASAWLVSARAGR